LITINEFAEKLSKEKSVAIFSHMRPDGDTVGSAVALKLALNQIGIKADLFCVDPIPQKFSYMAGCDYKTEITEEYTAFFAIDCAEIHRTGDFAESFYNHKNTYNLDHHVSNSKYAKVNLVIDCAANCENTYNLINLLGAQITPDIANALITGLVTDTGNFRHKNLTAETLFIASDLVKKGADLNKVVYQNFTMQTKARAKLHGVVMSKIRYFHNDKLAIATVFKKDVEQIGAKESDTEGFIDFVMGIDTVEVGVCLMEMEKNKFHVSLRAKSVNVNEVALLFGGGGHILASGCRISGEYEEIVDKLQYAIGVRIPE
jgi:phosphoesterase RecJ-like protein